MSRCSNVPSTPINAQPKIQREEIPTGLTGLTVNGVPLPKALTIAAKVSNAINSKTGFNRGGWDLKLALRSASPDISFAHEEGTVRIFMPDTPQGRVRFTVGEGGAWAPALQYLHR